MRRRIFFKLAGAFALVIGVAAIFNFPLHAWKGTLLALLVALVISAIAAQATARRLDHIVRFADRIAAGDLAARIAETSGDEIGQVAAALDKTASHLEESFAALQQSQRQLETLLNSMQDAVIAVSADDRVQWANQTMDKLVPQRTRKNAPLVETVRDPDFLAAVRGASETRRVITARAASIVPGRTFDVTAAPMPGGGAVAVLRDLTETERVEKTRRDFIANVSHELRTPLTSIQGYTETLLDGALRQRPLAAISWKSSARARCACRASPKTCSRWRGWNPASSVLTSNPLRRQTCCRRRCRAFAKLHGRKTSN